MNRDDILAVAKGILFSPILPVLLVLATVGFFLANVAARAFAGTEELYAGVGVCLLLSVPLTLMSLVARRFVAGLLYTIPVVLFFTVPHRFIVELHWLAAMKNFEMKRDYFERCAEKARPTDGGKIAVCEVHIFMSGAYAEAIIFDSSGQISSYEKSEAWISISRTFLPAVPFGIASYKAEKLVENFYRVTFSGDLNVKP